MQYALTKLIMSYLGFFVIFFPNRSKKMKFNITCVFYYEVYYMYVSMYIHLKLKKGSK